MLNNSPWGQYTYIVYWNPCRCVTRVARCQSHSVRIPMNNTSAGIGGRRPCPAGSIALLSFLCRPTTLRERWTFSSYPAINCGVDREDDSRLNHPLHECQPQLRAPRNQAQGQESWNVKTSSQNVCAFYSTNTLYADYRSVRAMKFLQRT